MYPIPFGQSEVNVQRLGKIFAGALERIGRPGVTAGAGSTASGKTAQHGEKMISEEAKVNGTRAAAGRRVLVVEDELMIRMLLDGMLDDLGYTMAAEAGTIEEATALAKKAEFDIAILDVNLNGQPITPVVEILIERRLPFVFATGYGQRGVPEAYRTNPTLQKPFQVEALAQALKAVAPGVPG